MDEKIKIITIGDIFENVETKEKVFKFKDYITNLQQKVEQYENPDDMTLFYMWLDEKAKDKMKQLQEERNMFKESFETMTKNYFELQQELLSKKLNVKDIEYKEKMLYKSRIDKAIEYIEEHIKYECDDTINGMSFYSYHLYDFKKNVLKIMFIQLNL